MRKKALMEQNMLLFKQIDDLRRELNDVKSELKQKTDIIDKFNVDAINNNSSAHSESIEEIEKKVMGKKLPEDIDYGSEIIGKIVVDSANLSTALTANGETKYKELVNLILGKTEVAKSEILSVVNESSDIETKKEKIDNIYKEANEYFESVMAQKE